MSYFRRLLTLISTRSLEPDVTISQISAFSKQAPLLYIIGNANSFALAYTHYDSAPKFLTLIVPIPMFLACIIRVLIWKRMGRVTFTPESAQARLRATVRIAGVLGAIYVGWALCLFPYGDASARVHVAFFIAVSGIGTIFCLMHLRPAALLLTAVISVPFVVRFIMTGDPILTVMVAAFLVVVMVMVVILCLHHRDFRDFVIAKRTLVALSDQNDRLANLDSLTGLPNRRSFFRDAAAQLDERTEGGGYALGMIDLDGFKPVNDLYGHAAGDRVLIEVGHRLREALGPSSLIARLGGDEFGILVMGCRTEAEIVERGVMICEAVRLPIQLPGGVARVAASIGFAIASPDASTLEPLLERADYALYNAKAQHRGAAVLFSDRHENAIRTQSLLEQTLRKADLDTEMVMKFQPIVDISAGRIVAYEALARWISPAIGAISPADFIAAAERTGLIRTLTPVLFDKALAALRHWPADVGLSFNLSVCDVAASDLIPQVHAAIERHGILPSRIAFEIIETSLMHDFEQAKKTLVGLKALGAKISLDDFGTGFSSLHYVHQLPIDKIKMDRAFVTAIASDTSSRDIAKSIIDLCRNLNVECIAEGIETEEQESVLKSLGCHMMQGYRFGKPELDDDLRHIGSIWAQELAPGVRSFGVPPNVSGGRYAAVETPRITIGLAQPVAEAFN